MDVDKDGWYELNETFTVRGSSENITLPMSVPEMHDITLQLTSPVDPQTQEAKTNVPKSLIEINHKIISIKDLDKEKFYIIIQK